MMRLSGQDNPVTTAGAIAVQSVDAVGLRLIALERAVKAIVERCRALAGDSEMFKQQQQQTNHYLDVVPAEVRSLVTML